MWLLTPHSSLVTRQRWLDAEYRTGCHATTHCWTRNQVDRLDCHSRVPSGAGEEAVTFWRHFGHTNIRGRRGDSTSRKLFILVQTSIDLDPDNVYFIIFYLIPVSMQSWCRKFHCLLKINLVISNMNLVNGIGKLVDKCYQVSADATRSRKLRLFSCLKPVPSGQEEYDACMEQAIRMI